MKFSKWILSAALLFSTQVASVQGRNACEPCDPCAMQNPCDLCEINFCDVKYDVYADALYWQVAKGDLNVGRTRVDDVIDSGGNEEYLNPEFKWGYRVGGCAKWRNWDLGVRWTQLITKQKHSYATTDFNHAKFHFDYRVFDIELGHTLCQSGCFTFRPIVGGKFAWIDDKFDKLSGGQSNSKIKYHGYGLYLGACGRWELCNYSSCDWNIPIALVTKATAGVMHSRFKQTVTRLNDDEDEANFNDNREVIYTPYGDVYVGLDFRFNDMCGWDAFFQAGYEAQAWGWREYDSAEHITYMGLGGLVLRFGLDF